MKDRPRIHLLLDELVANHTLTLVSAPSGYSKTTVLASWVRNSSNPIAWLTLAWRDGDGEQQLLVGLLSALHRIVPSLGPEDARIVSGLVSDSRSVHLTLERIADSCGKLKNPIVVIVDDAHQAGSNLAEGALAVLAKHCGGKLRFVLSGAVILVSWFNRFLVDRTAGFLGSTDLALSLEELQEEFSTSKTKSKLNADEVARIHADTAGWPIAVQWANLAPETEELSASASQELLTEYVATSVLENVGHELASFILATTTCLRVNASLAQTLSGNPHSADLLEKCANQGIFLDRYVSGRDETVYQWNRQFAKQCRILMGRSDAPGRRNLNRLAARALTQQYPAEAINHALLGDDHQGALEILRAAWLRIVIESGAGALNALCLRLDTQRASAAEILLIRACCLDAMGDRTGSSLLHAQALSAIEHSDHLDAGTKMTQAFAELFLAHDAPRLGAAVDEARLAIEAGDTDAAPHAYRLFLVGWTELRLRRNPADAVRLLRSALNEAENTNMETLAGRSRANLIFALGYGGHLTAARSLMDHVDIPVAPSNVADWNHYDGGIELFTRGYIDYWQDRIPEAKRSFTEMIQRGGHRASYTALARTYLAFCAAATGDPREIRDAETHLGGISQTEEHGVPWPSYRVIATASLRAAAGEFPAALEILEGVRKTKNIPVVMVIGAEIHRLAGRPHDAMALLSGIEKTGMVSYVAVSALVTSAVISRERGDREEAHSQLEKALELAVPQSIARPFAGQDEGLSRLLTEHAVWGTAHEGFLASRIAHLDEGVSRHSILGSRLTSRELEIFGYLRTTMTAEEIAAVLFVSVNTVRTHQRSIYRKLGVGTRREAIKYRP